MNFFKGYELLLLPAESHSRMGDPSLPSLLTNAIRAMESYLHTQLSVEGLVSERGICRATLNRLSRRYLNMTPLAYWNRIRMEHARQLVVAGQFLFKKIAARLGFIPSIFPPHSGVMPGCPPPFTETGKTESPFRHNHL